MADHHHHHHQFQQKLEPRMGLVGAGVRVHYDHHEDQAQKSLASLASSFPTPLPGRNRAYPAKHAYFGRQRILGLVNHQSPHTQAG